MAIRTNPESSSRSSEQAVMEIGEGKIGSREPKKS